MEQLVVIRSVMKPRNYSTLRAILKKEQGEKVNPKIYKLENSQSVLNYLEKQKITYNLYEKKSESKLEQAYRAAYADKSRERECRIWDVLETESWGD